MARSRSGLPGGECTVPTMRAASPSYCAWSQDTPLQPTARAVRETCQTLFKEWHWDGWWAAPVHLGVGGRGERPLRRWHRPGLLCIRDAAHAMPPVGRVGINLAV